LSKLSVEMRERIVFGNRNEAPSMTRRLARKHHGLLFCLLLGPLADHSQAAELPSRSNDHWSFQPIRVPPAPPVRRKELLRTNSDRFIEAALEKQGLALGQQADRASLLRRLAFDLTGLPPTPAEIEAFLADRSSDAYERRVEHYLASPHYGERWGKYWLDAAGYADSNGYFNADSDRPLAYRYRDYVIDSFNRDKPYDLFVREQLAGDEMAGYVPGTEVKPEMIEPLIATHFLRNAPDGTGESDGNPDEQRTDRFTVLEGNLQNVMNCLLGITIQCARCHSHKFEPIAHEEYYRLQAIFFPAYCPERWITPKDRVLTVAGRAQSKEPPEKLAVLVETDPHPPVHHVLRRGLHNSPGKEVQPGVPAALCRPGNTYRLGPRPKGSISSGRRSAFARWATSPENPLLVRSLVNRVWQHHFGAGIVATPDNLGQSGAKPTHPELLDYLASEFMRSGWSIKQLHRLVLNSAVYRQSSARRDDAFRVDPDNRLLWRYPLRRLDAESLRDAMLAVSGELDGKAGGSYVPVTRKPDGRIVVAEQTAGARRRSIYLQQRRSQVVTLLSLFDAPSMAANCGARTISTVPLQSLALLNDDFVQARAEALARRLEREAGTSAEKRLALAFQLVCGRSPTDDEQAAARRFLARQQQLLAEVKNNGRSNEEGRQVWTDFCQMLLASNAFLYVE
jgi:hypothetical protein